MAPPSYADIGKQARDVFGKGYHFGIVKLDVKTKTTSGVEFNAGGTSSDGKVSKCDCVGEAGTVYSKVADPDSAHYYKMLS